MNAHGSLFMYEENKNVLTGIWGKGAAQWGEGRFLQIRGQSSHVWHNQIYNFHVVESALSCKDAVLTHKISVGQRNFS